MFTFNVNEESIEIHFEETVRGSKHSIIKAVVEKTHSVGGSMTTVFVMCLLSKERGYKYFLNAKEWSGSGKEYFYKIYFTKDPSTPLKRLLGNDYSKYTQLMFDELKQDFDGVGYINTCVFCKKSCE